MRHTLSLVPVVLTLACGGHSGVSSTPTTLILPDSTVVLDAATGAPVSTAELLRRANAADFVLLGELHDNPAHHQARGALLVAGAARKPAVVFEQMAWGMAPIAPPAGGESEESWLDAHGFDRTGWKWPLHQPVFDAAIAGHGTLWGSNLPREALRPVVREGVGAAPAELGRLIQQAPLDSVGQAAIDQELFEGHCGKLPAEMVPGMRAAQQVRDAAMTDVLLAAGAAGPAWLMAGDGHVRMDMGVPRLLRTLAPAKKLLVVGFVERGTEEAVPGAVAGRRYQILVVTPPAAREDPCASL
jgi:uncharacterized iron-regulated protein